jgi:thioredoxin-related protein
LERSLEVKKFMIAGIFLSILMAGISLAAEPKSLAEAQTLAGQQNKPVLIDFYTTWCKYCKLFDKDAATDLDIQKALESVVLFHTDAEKGDGKTLAAQYNVKAYPTYILLLKDNKVSDRWAGYEKSYFLKVISEATADLVPVDEKVARYSTKPTMKDALSLGRYYSEIGEFIKSADCYNTAQKLREDSSDDFTFEAFESTVEGFDKSMYSLEDVVKSADAVLASNDKTADDVIQTAQMMIGVDKLNGKMELVQKYLEAALKTSGNSSDPRIRAAHDGILVDYDIFVKNDTAAAVAQKKANLPKDWENDVSALNDFCWWCFENNTNLKEAESLARHAADIAEPGGTKAMISDTAAEICFARGNKEDAIKFARQAIAEAPENKYYASQLEKFEGKSEGK